MRLELGWYKDPGNGNLVQLHFFAEFVENPVAIYQLNNRLHEMNPRGFAKAYEFVSVEKPDVWVPANPDKITLGMLPMKARFRDNDHSDWFYGLLCSYRKENRKKFKDDRDFLWIFCEVVQ